MRFLVRTWTALAALGAGMVHLAIAAGAPLPVLVAFAAVGVAEIVWAVVVLGTRRYPLAALTPPLLLIPLAIWALSVAAGVDTAALPAMPLVAATLLSLATAVSVAVHNRRNASRSEADEAAEVEREPSAWTVVAGLAVGAFAMTAIALPALGATAPGIAAMQGPHSHHSVQPEFDIDHEGH